jgi:hypothetical protein
MVKELRIRREHSKLLAEELKVSAPRYWGELEVP